MLIARFSLTIAANALAAAVATVAAASPAFCC